MVNIELLRGTIFAKGKTINQLAEETEMSTYTLYRRLKNKGDFTIKEVDRIVKSLNLNCEEATKIFFAQFVA